MGVVRWSKEAFQMNQFSISAFPRCLSCVCVTEYVQATYRRYISQSVVSTVKHESTQRGQIGSSVLMGDLVASGGVVRSSEKGRRAGLRPGSGAFPRQGFHPHPLLPPHTVSPGDCVVYRFSHPRH